MDQTPRIVVDRIGRVELDTLPPGRYYGTHNNGTRVTIDVNPGHPMFPVFVQELPRD